MRRMTYRLNGTWRCWSLFIGRTKGTGGGFSQGAGMSRLRGQGAQKQAHKIPKSKWLSDEVVDSQPGEGGSVCPSLESVLPYFCQLRRPRDRRYVAGLVRR